MSVVVESIIHNSTFTTVSILAKVWIYCSRVWSCETIR